MANDGQGDTWSISTSKFLVAYMNTMYQEERSMKTVLLSSTRHHHQRHRVPEQQATSEISLMIAAPATSCLIVHTM